MSISILIVSVSALLIGYTAQVTGLCMVRGVKDWIRGKWLRLIAILSSGFWIYLYLPLVPLSKMPSQLMSYNFHWSFLLGGILFGLGAASNGACSISTATRLSSGDLKMLPTIVGWLIGWLLLEYSGLQFNYIKYSANNVWVCWIALGCLILATFLVYWRYRQQWRMWNGIILVGVLAGLVFLLQPAWSPSDFIRDWGLSIVRKNPDMLPTFDRAAILITMLLGMTLGAWRHRRFHWVIPDYIAIGKHLASGTFMGVGAALALGGNDFQLLLALPAVSPAGYLATLGMLLGIRMGIALIKDNTLILLK